MGEGGQFEFAGMQITFTAEFLAPLLAHAHTRGLSLILVLLLRCLAYHIPEGSSFRYVS